MTDVPGVLKSNNGRSGIDSSVTGRFKLTQLGSSDTTIQVLDRLDLTNAQKRDERYGLPGVPRLGAGIGSFPSVWRDGIFSVTFFRFKPLPQRV